MLYFLPIRPYLINRQALAVTYIVKLVVFNSIFIKIMQMDALSSEKCDHLSLFFITLRNYRYHALIYQIYSPARGKLFCYSFDLSKFLKILYGESFLRDL